MRSKTLKTAHLEKNFIVIGQGDEMMTFKFSIPHYIVTQTGGVNER